MQRISYEQILVETEHEELEHVKKNIGLDLGIKDLCNQVIVSENLQIKNMVKNHHLAKSISDVSWYELTRQLEYKAKWNGREYIELTPVEIVGYEVCEAGSPLALDNG